MASVRQLLTWRFLAAVAALVVLALGVDSVVGRSTKAGSVAIDPARAVDLGADGRPLERRVDLVARIASVETPDGFGIGAGGTSVGTLVARLDEQRTMTIAPGTPGVVTCDDLAAEGACVVLADLLGEAVVWFAILPAAPRDTVEVPPVVDLQEGYAVFDNGWRIRYETVIERDCDGQDILNFSDFLRRFGPGSRTFVDLETQKVATVVCGPEYVAPVTVPEAEPLTGGSLRGAIDLVGGDDPSTAPATTVPPSPPATAAG